MLLRLIVFLVLVYGASAAAEDLADYKKYVVEHTNNGVYERMVSMQTDFADLDFWIITRNMSIVVVPPKSQPYFENILYGLGARYSVDYINMHGNHQENECSGESCPLRRSTRQASGFFRNFQRYGTIYQYMIALARRYPQYVRFEILGRSVENRPIGVLVISPNARTRSRKIAYIQGGAHAREWITTPTLLYFATELAGNMPNYRSILNDVEIHVVPMVNPDGYEYSQYGNRYWRKNRKSYPGFACKGVDINRNFGNHWNSAGSSQNVCSEVYSGRTPFSEPETFWVKTYLEKYRGRTKLVLDVHSFGSFLFYPYGFSRRRSAPTRSFLHSVAQRAAAAIYKYRRTAYKIGTSSDILYEASGGLDDYAYGTLGVPLSYTVELPGSGFEVDSREIVPIAKETFGGFIEFIRHVHLF